ncbi:MAG: 3-phosphoshikimate 1-carboxyvinyltransferase [Burkholderiales bacterium]|nr:3-phosphoshikimate 1-carboxyvinyltransferase [Opitutaceae bacterium]
MALPAQLPIVPFTRPVSGAVTIPGSKSLTNRALLLAALCDRPVTLTGALFSDDTRLMSEALRRLGLDVQADEATHTLAVANQAHAFKSDAPVDIFVGLAGTAARFLTALCAAAPRGVYRIQGNERMNQRPMRGLIDALRALGAEIRCTGVEGFFPIEIHAHGLRGGPVPLDASESSQLLSALLMVAPLAQGPVDVRLTASVRKSYVLMTQRLMADFGVQIVSDYAAGVFSIRPAAYTPPLSYLIEPDASAASYFIALPRVTGGTLALPGLRPPETSLQGDSAFAAALDRACNRPSGAEYAENFFEFSDTFLTLAAIAPLLPGPTTLTGLSHTRKQETDRVAGMVAELRRLGQQVHEHEDGDGLTLTPDLAALRAARGTVIQTYHDHRFAMSFGILGSHDLHGDGQPWLVIDNPACCAKTFPNFFDVLASLRS